MKILILVLSYDEPPYDALMNAQQQTWDSVAEQNIRTVYYSGGGGDFINHSIVRQSHQSSSHEIKFPCTDSYYYMADKFKRVLDFVSEWDYDIIFRTNSSSYVNKSKLRQVCQHLPLEKLYCGWAFTDSNYDGGDCVSGAGIFLSKDCAEILRNEINPEYEIEEDVYIGRLLRAHGVTAINERSRVDYPQQAWKDIRGTYHIRFKTDDRIVDSKNMIDVHTKFF